MHPVIYNDKGNVTLRLQIRLPQNVYNTKYQDTVMWLGGNLTSVSYKASWQNNQIVKLYNSTINNGEGQIDFNITDIPYGEHHLEVYASCGVIIFGSPQPFYDSGEQSLDFTVAVPVPTPTLTPTIAPTPTNTSTVFNLNLEQTAIIMAIVLAATVIAVVFYKRRQNTANPKGYN